MVTVIPHGQGDYPINVLYSCLDGNASACDWMTGLVDITSNYEHYIAAYCLQPPNDDSCPWGYCPQPDIAGPLIRVSAYLTNVSTWILMFYGTQEAATRAFWLQYLNIYAMLITSIITLKTGSLTLFHMVMVLSLVGSPLAFYIFTCIFWWTVRDIVRWARRRGPRSQEPQSGDTEDRRGFRGNLRAIVATGGLLRRALVLGAPLLWTGIYVVTTVFSLFNNDQFAQAGCAVRDAATALTGPISYIILAVTPDFLYQLPIYTLLAAWLVALLRRTVAIKETLRRRSTMVRRLRSICGLMSRDFSFLALNTWLVVPVCYWILLIELTVNFGSSNDATSTPGTFGQIIALFTVVPPLLDLVKLCPHVKHWFLNLHVVGLLCRQPLKRRVKKLPDEWPLAVLDTVFPGIGGSTSTTSRAGLAERATQAEATLTPSAADSSHRTLGSAAQSAASTLAPSPSLPSSSSVYFGTIQNDAPFYVSTAPGATSRLPIRVPPLPAASSDPGA